MTQEQEQKGIQCYRGCGQLIYFHDSIKSQKSGKKIPLSRVVHNDELLQILEDRNKIPAHDCPNAESGTVQQQQQAPPLNVPAQPKQPTPDLNTIIYQQILAVTTNQTAMLEGIAQRLDKLEMAIATLAPVVMKTAAEISKEEESEQQQKTDLNDGDYS